MTVGRDAQGGGSAVKRRVGGGSKQSVLPMRVKQSKPYVIIKTRKTVWNLCINAYNIYKCLKPP